MKFIYFLAIFLIGFQFVNAQQIFSTSGKIISNGNLSLSYTIGEPLVSRSSNNEITLSNGFQHAIIAKITRINDNLFKDNELLVYPNPSSGILNVYNKTNNIKLDINIYTLDGQLIFTKKYEELISEQLNLSSYSNALYILKIEDEQFHKFNTYKIQLSK
jgi:hypothetical protein